ncbi:MAG TPA: GNAT family N-acetyltransferase [Dehalococcoidales bacterium]|nr:GNAT family N-acetyltransferase [Dehalococcoidales bacterium]
MLTIRKAEIKDLRAITEIYNQAVLRTTATFDTAPKTVEEQRVWYNQHGPKYPVLVAEENGKVVGWASLSAASERCAYAGTAEGSIYIDTECRGKGVGRELGAAILKAGKDAGLHTVILKIAEGNEASMKLAKSLGFKNIGVMKEVGNKFGKYLDVTMMQIIFE